MASAFKQTVSGNRSHSNRGEGHRCKSEILSRFVGMRVAGESENYGTEQEHLNNVFGARLRITALRAASGPGIELLEYLAPRDGRPFPLDEKANDLVHRQTILVAQDADATARNLAGAKVNFVSSGVVVSQDNQLRFSKALVVRDPDGHAIEVEQK
jgi:hypothetical protein